MQCFSTFLYCGTILTNNNNYGTLLVLKKSYLSKFLNKLRSLDMTCALVLFEGVITMTQNQFILDKTSKQ